MKGISIDRLRIDYVSALGSVPAVRDASLMLRPGRILGIVGESGSGKSTLLGAIAGLLPASARIVRGTIEHDGRRIDDLSEDDFAGLRGRRISAMQQEAGSHLHPTMTVGAQIEETVRCLRARREASPSAVAAGLLRSVGLDPAVASSYPHRLSGGQRQRVGLALAIAGEPDVLLADEPTSALDTVARLGFADLMTSIVRRTSVAAMLVSHDIGLVGAVADEVLVMRAGEVVEQGPADRILLRPQHPYTARLIADTGRRAA